MAYPALRPLADDPTWEPEAALHAMADALGDFGESFVLQLRVAGTDSAVHTISVDDDGARVRTATGTTAREDRTGRANLAIVLTGRVLRQVLTGEYSPVQAFLDRQLRLGGDLDLGRRIYQRLAPVGAQAPQSCPNIDSAVWNPQPGTGSGLLTVNCSLCNDLGFPVTVIFNTGSNSFPQQVPVSSDGTCSVTMRLPCGDIPGHPGVGVIVTVSDPHIGSSGSSTTGQFATPCA